MGAVLEVWEEAVGVEIAGNCSKGLGIGPGSDYFNWSGS